MRQTINRHPYQTTRLLTSTRMGDGAMVRPGQVDICSIAVWQSSYMSRCGDDTALFVLSFIQQQAGVLHSQCTSGRGVRGELCFAEYLIDLLPGYQLHDLVRSPTANCSLLTDLLA